jgi:hypothetical protein
VYLERRVEMNTDVLGHIGLYSGIDERLALGLAPRPLVRNADFDVRLSRWHQYRECRQDPCEWNTVRLNDRMYAHLPHMDAGCMSWIDWTALSIHYKSPLMDAETIFRMTTAFGFKSGDIESTFDIDFANECPSAIVSSIEQTFKNGRWELVTSFDGNCDTWDDEMPNMRRWLKKTYGL